MICFFFSSRRRHTRLQGDWSSDVCSSDLEEAPIRFAQSQVLSKHSSQLESDLELHSGKLGPLRLRLIAATEEHVGAPFQQSKDSCRQDEQPLNRATKEDPDLGLLDRQRNREAASDHYHQAGQAVE